jgi:cholesterol transport system auxiliary component
MTASAQTRPQATRRQALRTLALAGLALPAGCTDLFKPAPLQRLYTLRAAAIDPAGLPSLPWHLAIPVPEASRGIASQRIALLHGPYALDYFAGAAWADQAPILLQSLLIESFQATGKLAAVGRDGSDWQADHTLDISLFDFEARYDEGAADGAPTILIRLTARLLELDGRRILASLDVQEQRTAERNAVEAIIPAFDQALGTVMTRLVRWTLHQGAPA